MVVSSMAMKAPVSTTAMQGELDTYRAGALALAVAGLTGRRGYWSLDERHRPSAWPARPDAGLAD